MRIISGSKKSYSIKAPKNLPIRPTTDFCKESLFNIIENHFNIKQLKVLDLFSGSGNISFEFASRGSKQIVAVDKHYGCYKFIKTEATKLEFENIKPLKSDCIKFLQKLNDKFDIIFADPPYDFKEYEEIIRIVFEKELLNENGWLILEHATERSIQHEFLKDQRKYGQSKLSFLYK